MRIKLYNYNILNNTMIEITDTISKILSNDKDNAYTILTFIDTNIEFNDETLVEYIENIINNFPIFKQYIVNKNSNIFLETDTDFNIRNHYKIIYDTYANFDSHIDTLVNFPFDTKSRWFFYYITDKENHKNRLYLKIDHAYADGYKIIEMLTTPLERLNTRNKFKHNNNSYIDTLYYLILGTLTMIFINFKVFIEVVFSSHVKPDISISKTDHIKCKSLKLSVIKEFAKKHNITVNDFLYSLMVKTDYLYTNIRRNLLTISPINISGGTHLNNMAPIFNTIINNDDALLKTVHETFNCYKYSLYIPFISFVLNNITKIISFNTLNTIYDSIIHKCDYVYSNIIGPNNEYFEDIHFLILAKNKEIVFNIISAIDNVNIICSFKEGIIKDKERFEQCIYKAYEELVQIQSKSTEGS